jgi:hypothetical protein
MRDVRTKLWIGLGVSVLAGTPATATVAPLLGIPTAAQLFGIQMATGPNEGGGGVLDATLALQLELQMMRAYIDMSIELLKSGKRSEAYAHVAHPLTVMYPAYKETLENRAVPFESELRRLATLVNNQATLIAEVEAARATVLERIEAAASTYGSWRLAARRIEVARMLLQAAGNDWLEVGRVDDPAHQKGRGYVLVARDLVAGAMAELTTQDAARAEEVRTGLAALVALLPAVGASGAGQLSDVLVSLARVELALSNFAARAA